jgi:hypothetical protein
LPFGFLVQALRLVLAIGATVISLLLRSVRLGVVGKADVVEFTSPVVKGGPPQPFPVEYKRGKPKAHRADEVQLCAQAICLEEMFAVALRLPGPILLLDQRQRHPGAPQLGMYPRPVRLQPGRLPCGQGRAEQLTLQRHVV